MTSVVVIGHVEWVEFLRAERLPGPGGIVQAERLTPRAAGSAVVAASVAADHGASVHFIGAVGDDQLGDLVAAQLRARGIEVTLARRPGPTRRAFVIADGDGERTIVTAGERWAPDVTDALHWACLDGADAVYLTAGDANVFARARSAHQLVATPRAADAALAGDFGPGSAGAASKTAAPVTLDALVFSSDDAKDLAGVERLRAQARLLIATEGAEGGHWSGESEGHWQAVAPTGPIVDSYGCGDAFAGGFTLGLAQGLDRRRRHRARRPLWLRAAHAPRPRPEQPLCSATPAPAVPCGPPPFTSPGR